MDKGRATERESERLSEGMGKNGVSSLLVYHYYCFHFITITYHYIIAITMPSGCLTVCYLCGAMAYQVRMNSRDQYQIP